LGLVEGMILTVLITPSLGLIERSDTDSPYNIILESSWTKRH